jgi:transcriptional regulator GlxA family with amidase domain
MPALTAREVVEKHQYDDLPSFPKVNIHFLATAPGNEHLLKFMTEKPDNPIRFKGKRIGIIATHGVEETEVSIPRKCVLGGAWNPDQLRANPAVLSFLQEFQATAKPLGALCHGSQVFLSAKLTKGRKATGYWAMMEDLANAGATVLHQPVVVDGNVITSRFIYEIPVEAIVAQLI